MKNQNKKMVAMVSAVSEVLKHYRDTQSDDGEILMRKMSGFFSMMGDDDTKILMIGATNKAISLIQKERNLTEKEIIRRVFDEMPLMIESIEEENSRNE